MAERFEVLSVRRAADGMHLPDFTAFELGRARFVGSDSILAGSHVMPLFLDTADNRVVFAQIPRSRDLRRAAFAFTELQRHARYLIAVSYDELHSITRNVDAAANPIFVFNTSRCGSTLLHRVFNQVTGVSSIGELSIVADLARLANDSNNRELVVRLLRDTVLAAAAPFRGQAAFKHLACCTSIADLHHAAFPSSQLLFLYRNAIDWAASWQRLRERQELGDVDMSIWLNALDAFSQCQVSGTPLLAVRYEDLSAHPRETLLALFGVLNWPRSAVDAALDAFGYDAQADTDMARAHGQPNRYRLNSEQLRSLYAQLNEHSPTWPTDPRLARTLRITR